MGKQKSDINVLVACEESQAVCMAFRKRGFNAYSCDIQECSGGNPKWHLKMDALKAIKYGKWDLVIAHPPCTYLANSGAVRLYPKSGIINEDRYQKGLDGKEFFMSIINTCNEKNIPYCIENPVPSRVFALPRKTQVIEPYYFGEPYSKKTYLWLKGLPLLSPTNVINKNEIMPWVSGGSKSHTGQNRLKVGGKHRDSKTRSKTFKGIAEAMASQWGDFIFNKD